MPYSLRFEFDERGHGKLELLNGESIEMSYLSRSGSIDSTGKLVKCIAPRMWYILDRSGPESTPEIPMTITPGAGWKVRLYRFVGEGQYAYEGFLIHPDGNKPGSEGCIVTIKDDALALKEKIRAILRDQKNIEVKVTKKGATV